MKFRVTGGTLELEPLGNTLQDISDKLKKIAQEEVKVEDKRVKDEIFKPSGEITTERQGRKENII